MIYLDDEFTELLKEVPNVSGLINCLLTEYFKTNIKDKNKLNAQKINLEKEITTKVEILEKEKEKIIEKLDKINEEELTATQLKAKEEHKKANRISSVILNFSSDGVVLTEEEAIEYLDLFDASLTTYSEFLKSKKDGQNLNQKSQ